MTASLVRLGDLAEFVNGLAFKPEDWQEEGARIIRIQNLTEPTKPYNRTTRTVEERYVVHPGDLLVSWSASLGVFEWFGPDTAVLNQHIFRVIPNTRRVDKRYLRYALDEAIIEMRRHLHGATMQHVNRGEFLDTRVVVPTLAEQRRIAAILCQADELRRKRQQTLDRIGHLGEAVFKKMFGDNLDAGIREMEPLGEHLSFITSGGRDWARFYAANGKRFLRSLDVQMNEISNEDIVFVNPPENAEARRTRVEGGDVLLTITGSRIGRVAAVSNDLAGSYVSQHVAILRPKTSILPRFLSFYLSINGGGQRQIAKAQYGQTKPGLNFEQIRAFRIPVPKLQLQKQFVKTYEDVDILSALQRTHLSKLEGLFASLQRRAFYGELSTERVVRELEMAG